MIEKSDYIRVTTVLSPFSGLDKIPKAILDNARDKGTYVHAKCDAYIKGIGDDTKHPEWDLYFKSFLKWTPKIFIKTPERLFCDNHMITGECDAIYKDGEDLVLVDFKTPVNEGKTWLLQGSAYSYLAKKAGYDIKRIEFVKLSKEGKTPKVYIYEENFDLFLKCLAVYRHFFKNNGQENPLDYL